MKSKRRSALNKVLLGTFGSLMILVFRIQAQAACTSPSGVSGQFQWFSSGSTVKYCNGNGWVDAAKSTGASCSGTTVGTMKYVLGMMSFCNGTNWIGTLALSIGSCAGTTAGTLAYDSALMKMKFCDGTNWYEFGSVSYATLNPADKGTNIVLTNANLTCTSVNIGAVRGTSSKSSGKWYFELYSNASINGSVVGIATASANLNNDQLSDANTWGYLSNNGSKTNGGTQTAYGTQWKGSTVGVAFDADNGTLEFFLNGTSQGIAFTGLSGAFFPVVSGNGNGTNYTVNFGASAFTYSPPSGFSGWSN